jgi:outer membrane protein assembly factor BamB
MGSSRSLKNVWAARAFLLVLGVAAASQVTVTAAPADVSWQQTFEHPVKFQAMVDESLLVVGTARHFYGLDPRDGELVWRERNVDPLRNNVFSAVDLSYLLVADAAGGRFGDASTHVLSLRKADGGLVWESPALEGAVLQGVIDRGRERLIVVTVPEPHGDDSGVLGDMLPGKGIRSGLRRAPVLNAVDMVSGGVLWTRPFGRQIRLRPTAEFAVESPDDGRRPFDLDSYHPPFLLADMVCVTYRGVACFDWGTGEPVWEQKLDVIEDELGLAYAPPLVLDGQLLASGGNRVYAFDPLSGRRLWRSARSDYFPELQADDDSVYAQLGGRFYDLDAEKWVWKGKFGAMAMDRRTGKTRWRFAKGDDSVTNLLVIGNRVWLADEDRLYALDRRSGSRRVRARHGLDDRPMFAVANARGEIVLISESGAAAFTGDGDRVWRVSHPPPRPGPWKRLSAQLLWVSGTLIRLGSTAVSVSGGLVPSIPAVPVAGMGLKLFSSKKLVTGAAGRVEETLMEAANALADAPEYSQRVERYQYFLTSVEGSDDLAIATVDISSGTTVNVVPIPAAAPNMVLDEERGLLLVADGVRLSALRIHPGGQPRR